MLYTGTYSFFFLNHSPDSLIDNTLVWCHVFGFVPLPPSVCSSVYFFHHRENHLVFVTVVGLTYAIVSPSLWWCFCWFTAKPFPNDSRSSFLWSLSQSLPTSELSLPSCFVVFVGTCEIMAHMKTIIIINKFMVSQFFFCPTDKANDLRSFQGHALTIKINWTGCLLCSDVATIIRNCCFQSVDQVWLGNVSDDGAVIFLAWAVSRHLVLTISYSFLMHRNETSLL